MLCRLGELCRTGYIQNQGRDVPKFIDRLQYFMTTCLRIVPAYNIRLIICSLFYGPLKMSDSVALPSVNDEWGGRGLRVTGVVGLICWKDGGKPR